jgi:hypothetical protein
MSQVEKRWVARFGSSGVAAIGAGIWGIPLCFFAGGVDFDSRAYWGLYMAIALFPAWVLLAARAHRLERELVATEGVPRRRRFEVGQMGRSEKGWALGFAAAIIAIIGWLNAAATVDLGGLAPGLAAGNGKLLGLVEAAVLTLICLIAVAVYCWFRNAGAYLRRVDALSAAEPPAG